MDPFANIAQETQDNKQVFVLKSWAIIYYVLIILFGVCGNVVVIVVITRSKQVSSRSIFNSLLLSLAVADVVVSITALPFYLMLSQQIKTTVASGDVLCKTYIGFCSPFLFMNISQFLLVSITLERRNVLHSLKTLKKGRTKKTMKYIAVSVLCSVAIQSPSAIGLRYTDNVGDATIGNYCYYKRYHSDKWLSYVIYSSILLLQSIIPFGIMFLSFRKISRAIEHANNALVPFLQGYKQDIKAYTVVKQREQTVKLLKLVVLFFLLCLLPNHILFVVTHYTSVGEDITWNSDLYQLGILLWETNSCINPILYCFYSKDFRKTSYKVFNKLLYNNIK